MQFWTAPVASARSTYSGSYTCAMISCVSVLSDEHAVGAASFAQVGNAVK